MKDEELISKVLMETNYLTFFPGGCSQCCLLFLSFHFKQVTSPSL